MKLLRTLLVGLAMAGALFGAAVPASAGPDVNVSSGLTAKGPGLAVHGYDVVAYFTDGQPTVGRAKFSTVHNDATYRFASRANLEAFEDNPEAYLPQYGGFCAYGVAVGAKFDGDPQLWEIVDGKLYLNLNEEIQAIWEKDVPGYVEDANDHWKNIADKTPEELS
ncbi:MAG: YHS domain-containing (seleno)protein [Pseudomonadota bacterium]